MGSGIGSLCGRNSHMGLSNASNVSIWTEHSSCDLHSYGSVNDDFWRSTSKMKKAIRKFNHWFWNDGMDWLPFIVVMTVYIVWIIYGIAK